MNFVNLTLTSYINFINIDRGRGGYQCATQGNPHFPFIPHPFSLSRSTEFQAERRFLGTSLGKQAFLVEAFTRIKGPQRSPPTNRCTYSQTHGGRAQTSGNFPLMSKTILIDFLPCPMLSAANKYVAYCHFVAGSLGVGSPTDLIKGGWGRGG